MNNSSVKPKVSVIVPVYKAEAYLHRCLDSLLAQTFKDFEVLLIDDGSPDRSGEICDEYAAKDARFRVFHKENGGVASARQMGIDNAHGEYSIHCDPDDWVEVDYLEKLYNQALSANADMVICNYITHINDLSIRDDRKVSTLKHTDILRQVLDDEIHGSTCNKLIRTNLYSRYNVRFPENINYMEDTFVICQLLSFPIKVSYIPDALYNYDRSINSQSLTKKTEGTRKKSNIESLKLFIDKLQEFIPSADFTYRKILYKKYLWGTFDVDNVGFIGVYHEVNDTIIEQYKNNKNKIPYSIYVAIKYNYRLGRLVFYWVNVCNKLKYTLKKWML